MLNRNVETEFGVKEKKIAFIALPFGVKEKKIAFIALPGKGGHSRLVPSRLCPPLGRIAGSFIAKRGKMGFQRGIRVGADTHSSFFRGILVVETDIRGSLPDHDGGLLGYCLK